MNSSSKGLKKSSKKKILGHIFKNGIFITYKEHIGV